MRDLEADASYLQLVSGVELASASDAGINATLHISRQSGRVVGVLDSINALNQVLKENPTTVLYAISSK